jgi:alkanesulfonate monooxygenase SsuD/methylene tetrahydromethanopterin reductase-like flavin-dependent oxidoreductase (luciferase family)
MEFGVHLPQIGWDKHPFTLDRLIAVATTAQRLGFGTISANDHLVYGRPWLDGPVALAAILAAAPRARLMTSVALPVIRGPFALAKTLGVIDLLSGGRLEAGLGPGSSEADYAVAGIPFSER